MLPLSDVHANRYIRWPLMTFLILFANIIAFIFSHIIFADQLRFIIDTYGSTPSLMLSRQGLGIITTITSTFLHADLSHLGGNMYILWVFGRRVEDVCGPWRFLGFYILCATGADLLSTIGRFDSPIPSIGASGAVFGLLGAYLILFHDSSIRTLVVVWLIPTVIKLRALWVVLYFMVIELINLYRLLFLLETTYVNHWAHIGGFLCCGFSLLFLRPPAFYRYWNKLPL